jgi:adenosylmethionine-8-amino-7-oxononanoate aminotransferase
MPYPIWHTHTGMRSFLKEPLTIVGGSGPFLIDTQGKKYINGFGGLSLSLGLSHPALQEEIEAQAKILAYTPLFRMANQAALDLADDLVRVSPQHLTRVVFSNSGAEAVEAAIKIARDYFALQGRAGKRQIVTLEGSYHGCTFGTLAASAIYEGEYDEAYGLDTSGFLRIASPYCYRCPFGREPRSCGLECADSFAALIAAKGADSIAALVVEPVLAAAGVLKPPPGYLDRLAQACRRHDILFIADESATGFGRTGTLFAVEQSAVDPDMLVLSKAINGGYLPIAATLVTEKLFAPFFEADRPLVHGCSQAGNALAARAASAALRIFERERVLESSYVVAEQLTVGLRKLTEFPFVGDVRTAGMMFAIELVRDRSTREPLRTEVVYELFRDIQRRGLILNAKKNRLVFFPPLNLPSEVAGAALTILRDAFNAFDCEPLLAPSEVIQ